MFNIERDGRVYDILASFLILRQKSYTIAFYFKCLYSLKAFVHRRTYPTVRKETLTSSSKFAAVSLILPNYQYIPVKLPHFLKVPTRSTAFIYCPFLAWRGMSLILCTIPAICGSSTLRLSSPYVLRGVGWLVVPRFFRTIRS